jgi:transcriptional regulator with XRE-family HTH domain
MNMPRQKYQPRELHPTGKLLKQLRKQSGYTQEQLRVFLGFQAASAVSKLESRDFSPDLPRLRKLLQLLKPDAQQQAEILAYFGFSEEELTGMPDPLWRALETQEQPPEIKALDRLFYLFTYQRAYEQVIQEATAWQQTAYQLPQELDTAELQLILRELFASRSLLAQAVSQRQLRDAREAELRVHNTLSLFQQLPAHPFVLTLHIHALTLLYTAIYSQLHLQANQHQLSLPDWLPRIHYLQQELLPQLTQALTQTDASRPMRHLQLFVQRDSLQLLSLQASQQDEVTLRQWLGLPLECTAEERTQQLLTKLMQPGTWNDLYTLWLAPTAVPQQLRQATLDSYASILEAHQLLQSWDGEAPEVLRPLVNTFLAYPLMLARTNRLSEAQLALNFLYLCLNTADTHYHWHSNRALVAGIHALHALGDGASETAILPYLQQLAEHLLKALELASQVQGLSHKRILHYTFYEEPIFIVCLSQLQKVTALPDLPQQLLRQAHSYWAQKNL